MAELYQLFAKPWEHVLDFSDAAKISLFNAESYGLQVSANNGYALGKKMLNLQVTSWKEMLREGTLAKFELYEDGTYPLWWLDSCLSGTYTNLNYTDVLSACKKASGG